MKVQSVLSQDAALFLDLDGTLAPIAERPEDVGCDPARNALLRRLARLLDGRLAIVSGRSLDDVDRIMGASIRCVAGVHGLERRNAAGRIISSEPHDQLDQVYTVLEAFARAHPGLYLEFKLLGVALHYRQAPHLAGEVLTLARRLAWTTGMKLQEGRMVVELRSPGADKGDTVRSYMKEAPFKGAVPIFIGDDVTDEDGFAAVEELGGIGILVGERRDTKARAHLRTVQDVLGWLQNGLETGLFDFA